jgi:fumarate reductase subunit D|tara:strand:- start:626 stop:766 length:141 start_codon:yes stop_codon:yes gene_type:complete
MLQLQLYSWLLGVLVLAVGILLPLGLAASRNKLLQQAWEKATGKTV